MADATKISDLLETGGNLLAQAYRRGYRDGVASAKARIVSSLSGLDENGSSEPMPEIEPESTSDATDIQRGAVRTIVMRALSEQPGSRVVDVQKFAVQERAGVSPVSIGGELRRRKGEFYHQRLHRWYLTEDGKKEAAGIARQAAPAAPHNSSQGELYEAPLAASPSG